MAKLQVITFDHKFGMIWRTVTINNCIKRPLTDSAGPAKAPAIFTAPVCTSSAKVGYTVPQHTASACEVYDGIRFGPITLTLTIK